MTDITPIERPDPHKIAETAINSIIGDLLVRPPTPKKLQDVYIYHIPVQIEFAQALQIADGVMAWFPAWDIVLEYPDAESKELYARLFVTDR